MIRISAFYRFVSLPDYKNLKPSIEALGKELGLLGTILLAEEGINSTLCGSPESVAEFFKRIGEIEPKLANLEFKDSFADEAPFHRWKVKLKKEIVTMKVPGISPNNGVGTYVSAEEWNDLIQRDDVMLIDCRNTYEFSNGTFRGAIDPKTMEFHEFPSYVEKELKDKTRPIAMFCTGGIRCEKSTAYLKQLGFEEVYHLQGGILKYLKEIPEEQSLFDGHCFIFDDRRAVDHNLKEPESAN